MLDVKNWRDIYFTRLDSMVAQHIYPYGIQSSKIKVWTLMLSNWISLTLNPDNSLPCEKHNAILKKAKI